jgi:hypothetical protein
VTFRAAGDAELNVALSAVMALGVRTELKDRMWAAIDRYVSRCEREALEGAVAFMTLHQLIEVYMAGPENWKPLLLRALSSPTQEGTER